MAVDGRQKNKSWRCADEDGGINYQQATLATLMDIRDELQAVRGLLGCYRIPRALDAMISLKKVKKRAKPAVRG